MFLLEIIIGIGLSACLLSVLFRFLVSYATIEKKIEAAQTVLLEQARIQEKLGDIFTSIELVEEMEASFYTLQFPDETSISLILSFNAGVDPDPAFSGPNIGRLYLNKKGEFCLTQWTRAKNEYRTEVLLKNIAAFDWELLGKKQEKDMKTIPIAGSWAWLPHWPKKQGSIPSMIRLKLWCNTTKRKQSEPNLQFAFILPTQEPIQIFK